MASKSFRLLLLLLCISGLAWSDPSCHPDESTCLNLDPECVDEDDNCYLWAQDGQCDKAPTFMAKTCRQSCEHCLGPVNIKEREDCVDLHPKCQEWSNHGECIVNPGYMLKACRVSCRRCISPAQLRKDGKTEEDILKLFRYVKGQWGEPQRFEGDESEKAKTKPILMNMHKYALENATSLSLQERSMCRNNYDNCAFWAMMGECQNNLNFMMTDCPLACQFCHTRKTFQRCKRADGTDSWMTHGWIDHTVRALNRTASFQLVPDVKVEKDDDPWVLKVDNFLTSRECDELLEQTMQWNPSPQILGQDGGVEGSYVRRQSRSAYCENCPSTEILKQRIEKVLSVPPSSVEPIEFVHYGLYQSFGAHADFSLHDVWMPAGPRALTVFITLNDVEEGGSMGFPDLDWTKISAKKGQLLVWPNVLSNEPFRRHTSMNSEGLPVRKGEKYGLYTWVRLFDYKHAQQLGCV